MHPRFFRAVIGAAVLSSASFCAVASEATHLGATQSPNMQALRTTIASARSNATPKEFYANPDRAYPPSCLQSPLTVSLGLGFYQNDPNAVQTSITLPGDAYNSADASYTETVTVTIFRVPCSGGTSALLMEIDRPSTMEGNTTSYPVVPVAYVPVGSSSVIPLRLPLDPNTFLSDTVAGTPLYNSTIFVLENYYNAGDDIDFNQAVPIDVYNLMSGSSADTAAFDIPAYAASKYAAASQPMPISGYLSGNWFNSAKSGEGIETEVGEIGTATSTTYPSQRYIKMTWYTYDSTGTPYWLAGSGVFNIGETKANVTLAYASGGGFAGDFTKVTQAEWGTVTVQFNDCNTMQFTLSPLSTLPSNVPTTTGTPTLTWTRLTTINSLTCQ